MKTTKRVLSLLVALALGLALCVPAFAAEACDPDEVIIAQEDEEEPGGEEESEEPPGGDAPVKIPWWHWMLFFLTAPISLPLIMLGPYLIGGTLMIFVMLVILSPMLLLPLTLPIYGIYELVQWIRNLFS